MATNAPFTVRQGNDETVRLTFDRIDPADDLTAVTVVEFYLKDDRCAADAAGLLLSSATPADLTIVTATAAQLVADVHIPGSALTEPYDRWYHADGLDSGGARRTALFGLVTVTDL